MMDCSKFFTALSGVDRLFSVLKSGDSFASLSLIHSTFVMQLGCTGTSYLTQRMSRAMEAILKDGNARAKVPGYVQFRQFQMRS
jgi:hypothetical protein